MKITLTDNEAYDIRKAIEYYRFHVIDTIEINENAEDTEHLKRVKEILHCRFWKLEMLFSNFGGFNDANNKKPVEVTAEENTYTTDDIKK